MKFILILLSVVGFVSISSIAEAQRQVVGSIKCKATDFRAGELNAEDTAIVFGLLVKNDGKMVFENYGGHVFVSGYYGVFNGKNLVEVPFKRKPTVYQNHYKFDDFDAPFTAGHESGMWGYLVINKNIEKISGVATADAHYVFKAGDHIGGTIDFACSKEF